MPAAADPDLALRLAKATVDLYATAATRLLEIVARRLAQGISSPGWAERKALEVVQLRDEAQAVLERLVSAGPEAIREAIERAAERGERDADVDLTGLDLRAGLGVPGTESVARLITETISHVVATHTAILRQVLDAYRSVVAEVAGAVVTGTQTRLQAAQSALDRFAQRGISGFTDRSGRRWELESYVEMAVRTSAGRAQVAGTLDRLSAAGRDLVIVSDAPQECSVCRPWEGKVLSITGGDPERPSVATAIAAGLLHANCRHNLTAFVPGLTIVPTHTADPAGDRARQQQRYLERGVRAWKRREAVAITPEARTLARRHVRQWQARLGEHVDDQDLQRRRERERIGSAR